MTKTVRGTKREAERELARLVAQVDDGVVTAMGRTVGEICERWFNLARCPTCPPRSDLSTEACSTATSCRSGASFLPSACGPPTSTSGTARSA